MTPKEKALNLFLKFRQIPPSSPYTGVDDGEAKQCALVAVDEMLNEYPNQCPKDSYEYERHLYWLEVRSEIENL